MTEDSSLYSSTLAPAVMTDDDGSEHEARRQTDQIADCLERRSESRVRGC